MTLRRFPYTSYPGDYTTVSHTSYGVKRDENSHLLAVYDITIPATCDTHMSGMTKDGWVIKHVHIVDGSDPRAMYVLWERHDMLDTPITTIRT